MSKCTFALLIWFHLTLYYLVSFKNISFIFVGADKLQRKRQTKKIYSLIDIYKSHDGNIADKWESYLHAYSQIFSYYRNEYNDVRLLEIGVLNGGSIEIWKKYFGPKSEVVGIDIIDQVCKMKLRGKIETYCFDITDLNILNTFVDETDSFDIIIDDASHNSSDIILTFPKLFRHLTPGGTYCIEDLFGAYHDYGKTNFTTTSAISYFQNLTNFINLFQISRVIEIPKMTEDELYLSQWLESVTFHDALVTVRKRPQARYIPMMRVVTGVHFPITKQSDIDDAYRNNYFANTQKLHEKKLWAYPFVTLEDGSHRDSRSCVLCDSISSAPPPCNTYNSQLYIKPEYHYHGDCHLLFEFDKVQIITNEVNETIKKVAYEFCYENSMFFSHQNCDDIIVKSVLRAVEENEINELIVPST